MTRNFTFYTDCHWPEQRRYETNGTYIYVQLSNTYLPESPMTFYEHCLQVQPHADCCQGVTLFCPDFGYALKAFDLADPTLPKCGSGRRLKRCLSRRHIATVSSHFICCKNVSPWHVLPCAVCHTALECTRHILDLKDHYTLHYSQILISWPLSQLKTDRIHWPTTKCTACLITSA